MSTDNRVDIEPEDRVAAHARAWFVRLQDDDVSVEEIAEWQAWLTADPSHSDAYTKVEALWTAMADTGLDELVPDDRGTPARPYDPGMSVADWLAEEAPPVRPARTRYTFGWMALAASLLLAVGLVFQFAGDAPGPSRHDAELVASIATARAEQRTAKLFDGSQIELGGASKVAVDFTGRDRIVRLSQGEAYFEVAPNPEQPFVVETPFGNVTAVGTAFNIRLVRDRFVVTVTEGKIDVDPAGAMAVPEKTIRVKAGSALVLSENAVAMESDVKPAAPVSWRDGWLTYRAEPLEYVVEDINRYTKVRIDLMGGDFTGMSYSGSMKLAAIDDWLAALPAIFPVEVERTVSGRIRIRPAS
ncbi:MAG: DUF4880 domain-containing protein [Alphaproteobacteria bacterium]|nr:MAG: DUF4880 domain-containing protein [Alphaproteobacteria bacterium]